jgi:hypothetical protein
MTFQFFTKKKKRDLNGHTNPPNSRRDNTPALPSPNRRIPYVRTVDGNCATCMSRKICIIFTGLPREHINQCTIKDP